MLSQKQLMQSAKMHIDARQWNEARRILKTVDHQIARDWLAKIDQLEADEASQPKTGSKGEANAMIVIGLLIASFVIAIILSGLFSSIADILVIVIGLLIFNILISLWQANKN